MPYANREAKRKAQRLLMASKRAAFLADKSCVRCGSTERLEIDHIDRTLKVSHRVWTWAEDKRRGELAKCQVLCNPCHKVKTRSERPLAVCGSTAMYRRGCRCDECKRAKAAYAAGYLLESCGVDSRQPPRWCSGGWEAPHAHNLGG